MPIGSWDLSLNLSHGLTVQGRSRISGEPARSHSARLLGSDNVLEMVEMPCNSGWCWGQAVFANSLQSPQASGPWVYFPGVAFEVPAAPGLRTLPAGFLPPAARLLSHCPESRLVFLGCCVVPPPPHPHPSPSFLSAHMTGNLLFWFSAVNRLFLGVDTLTFL